MSDISTDEETADLKEAFSLFDKEGEGRISTKDLGDVMRCLGQSPTPAQLHAFIKKLDADKKGVIEEADFLSLVARKLEEDAGSQEEVREAFRLFDTEGDGFISSAELRDIMTSLGDRLTDQEVTEMILDADPQGDGRVNYEKFVSLMIRK
ncbi:hypothetical protein ACOMHN_051471 [Nucella lapillus]